MATVHLTTGANITAERSLPDLRSSMEQLVEIDEGNDLHLRWLLLDDDGRTAARLDHIIAVTE